MRRAAIRRMIVQRVVSKVVNRVASSKAANSRAANSKVGRNKAAASRKAKNPEDVKSGAVHTPRLTRDVLKKNVIREPCCIWRRYFSADSPDDAD